MAEEPPGTDGCKFQAPHTDGFNWAYNKGGCFICEESFEGSWLTEQALLDACQQTCASDSQCIGYEVSLPQLDAFSQFRGSGNCCLEYNLADESSPLYIASGSSTDNCEKEANCWYRVDKTSVVEASVGTPQCDSSRINPHPKCRQIYTWEDAHLVYFVDYVNNKCVPVDAGFDAVSDQNIYNTLLDTASEACLASMAATSPNGITSTVNSMAGSSILQYLVVLSALLGWSWAL